MNNLARLDRLESKLDGGASGPVVVVWPKEGETYEQARERTLAERPGVIPGHIIHLQWIDAVQAEAR